ncbi:2-succinyl-6-hydroxy-2,4-cyclohexadiene-1-carboxylate synthase [Paenisporosarcina cavernae]|nr:2-succinyl-6-hydroxy-2,4-cyclohexadiene-1-carboxylate synthase [Paenisporosarcina cavernae]
MYKHIQLEDGKLAYQEFQETGDIPILFLHGFTGTSSNWNEVLPLLPTNCHAVMVDIRGHGFTTDSSSCYTMDTILQDIELLRKKLKWNQFHLIGYSMGARISLAYALTFPERVRSIVLESGSPGLEKLEERLTRQQADSTLADKIETEGILSFVNFWEDIPLFHSQKRLSDEKKKAIREERLSQTARGLANSLRNIGTGSQFSFWDRLDEMQMRCLLVVGELDEKFVQIAQMMQNRNEKFQLVSVEDVGHAIHVENAEKFATIIMEFILQSEEELTNDA